MDTLDDQPEDCKKGMQVCHSCKEFRCGDNMNEIGRARKVFSDAFADDEDFRRAYRDNIAMRIYDVLGWAGYKPRLKKADRDRTADSIIRLIFEE